MVKEIFLEIVIARHGETVYNIRGLVNSSPAVHCPLTQRGQIQAIELGNHLRSQGHHFDAIFTSRLPRTVETLQYAYPFAEYSTNKLLDEVHTGICESQSHEIFRQILNGSVTRKPSGGESFLDVCARFRDFWGALKKSRYKKVLVIGHADTVRAAHVVIDEMDPQIAKFNFTVSNCYPYKLIEEEPPELPEPVPKLPESSPFKD